MSRKLLYCAGAGLILIVVPASLLVQALWPLPPEAVALREKFPYRSLSSRLAFDARGAAANPATSPVLPDAGRERLSVIEQAYDQRDSQARLLSLQRLHSLEVARFISRQGNGLSRMGRLPGADRLDYPEPPPIPVLAGVDYPTSGPGSNATTRDELPAAAIPSPDELAHFHLAGQIAFTDPWSLGDVKNRDQVAGFVSHGFTHIPVVGDPWNAYPRAYDPAEEREARPPSPWTIARLELVSLLKFDEPAVYMSDHLPRMQDLSDAKTRPLTAFEQRGLASLEAGEDLVTVVESNEIEMLGSLRAVKQCLACHDGERGRLLGAFSYRLRRTPPQPGPTSAKKPAT